MEQLKSVLDGIIRPLVYDAIESYFENNPIPGQVQATQREQEPEIVDVKGASKILLRPEQTIYQNIKKIPHMKRMGRLYFKRSELLAFLEEGATPIKKKGNKL